MNLCDSIIYFLQINFLFIVSPLSHILQMNLRFTFKLMNFE